MLLFGQALTWRNLMKKNLIVALTASFLTLVPQAGKAADEFATLLNFVEGKDLNDKGVQYYLSIRCASLYAYFSALMQGQDPKTSNAYANTAMALLEAAAINSYSTNKDMEKSFTYAQETLREIFDVYAAASKKQYNLKGTYITPVIDSDMPVCKVIAENTSTE